MAQAAAILEGPKQVIDLVGHEKQRGSIFSVVINDRIPEFVTTSADHSARVWDLKSGRSKRELFKRGGHHEWVTTAAYLPDGSIVTGGMDNQIILWRAGTAFGKQVGLHSSVSKVIGFGGYVLSSGYDGHIRLWDPASGREVSNLRICPRAVTTMCVSRDGARVYCGCRNGAVVCAELSGARIVRVWAQKVHTEAIVSITPCSGEFQCVSGGGDGRAIAWRGDRTYWKSRQHRGTITFVDAAPPSAERASTRVLYGTSAGEICTCYLGATIVVHDVLNHKAPVMHGVVRPGFVLSGDADGMLLCHALDDASEDPPAMCWAFGALKHAVRCIEATPDLSSVIVAGEDATGALLRFE
eukprot:gnl/Chilomastix_cuspidata/4500.p1 GENE.gnl/Chilomastix_cuspidata/4500~~gnl/Chilomastix_cuspidata/4500.p1  ORF type:complete len:355 (+),score=67.83 gnl/Chilomastix_cuspidata/4500:42-1106(+)